MQDIFQGIAGNHVLKVSFLAWLTAQGLKVMLDILLLGRLDLARLISAGGMPSSHSALVMALAVAVGRDAGWRSAVFAVAAVVAGVVMYDAAGVRRAAGKQAEVLNQIISDIYHGTQISQERLKELIGHTPFEVLMGGLLGIVMGMIL